MSDSHTPPNVEGMLSLKVDNLTYCTPPSTPTHELESSQPAGDVYIVRNPVSKESLGFAFVRSHQKRQEENARDAVDGILLDDRELRMQKAQVGQRSLRSRHARLEVTPRKCKRDDNESLTPKPVGPSSFSEGRRSKAQRRSRARPSPVTTSRLPTRSESLLPRFEKESNSGSAPKSPGKFAEGKDPN
ncbi:serine/arginine-rich splicing factor 2-like [Echinops telfairi]|uniref:Serine/arginine-rich splicing factor 2-like n=1 Tax=Echinops telfairi TaxID=9371 RepID=A0AC55D0S0_ECHTE|nr:serine/arginine-rich splicing factor 2-like [Echinops telfairi]